MEEEKTTYYQRNKEARCAYQRRYYRENKDKINMRRKIDEASDPEKAKKRLEYNKEYYQKNKKKLLEARAKRYRELRDKKDL